MITDAANALSQKILDKVEENRNLAAVYALSYAEKNKPEDRDTYQRYTEKQAIWRTMHAEVCRGLHAVEAEMTRRLKK